RTTCARRPRRWDIRRVRSDRARGGGDLRPACPRDDPSGRARLEGVPRRDVPYDRRDRDREGRRRRRLGGDAAGVLRAPVPVAGGRGGGAPVLPPAATRAITAYGVSAQRDPPPG